VAREPLLVTVGRQRRDHFGSIADFGDPDERTSAFGSPLIVQQWPKLGRLAEMTEGGPLADRLLSGGRPAIAAARGRVRGMTASAPMAAMPDQQTVGQ